MLDLSVNKEAHLLFSCSATFMVTLERRFERLPFTLLEETL
jgi:hypothetical protein